MEFGFIIVLSFHCFQGKLVSLVHSCVDCWKNSATFCCDGSSFIDFYYLAVYVLMSHFVAAMTMQVTLSGSFPYSSEIITW
jgi:hypothetical protein